MEAFSGMSFEEIQETADNIISLKEPLVATDTTLRTIIILITNLAARMKENEEEK